VSRPRPRVLLVEDDESIQQFVEMALSDEGYQVACAGDGADALAAIERHHPALILLDLRMPGMDGWCFAHAYRQAPGPKAPVVLLTAARDPAGQALALRADGFLAKPFELAELLDLVGRLAGSA